MCSSFIHSFIHSFICQSLLGSCCGQAYAEPWECGIRHVCYPHGTYHLVEDLARKVGEGHTTEHPKYHTEFGLYSVSYKELRSLLCRELPWFDMHSRRITLEAVQQLDLRTGLQVQRPDRSRGEKNRIWTGAKLLSNRRRPSAISWNADLRKTNRSKEEDNEFGFR